MYTFEACLYDFRHKVESMHTIQIEEQFTGSMADAWAIAIRKATHTYKDDGSEAPLPWYTELVSIRVVSY